MRQERNVKKGFKRYVFQIFLVGIVNALLVVLCFLYLSGDGSLRKGASFKRVRISFTTAEGCRK